ncbi:MAG: TRAP transporter substrate-binding protein DctP [Chloroflexi bacterium]|nr:TRAP transporter substrate-binding protein DctP [Chloroflexota bacterium]
MQNFPSDFPGLVSFLSLNMGTDHKWRKAASRIVFDEGEISAKLQEEFAKQNLKPLFLLKGGPRFIISKKPVRSIADLKGMKIRSTGSYLPKLYSKLGMVPVTVSTAELYDALAKGLVDAVAFAPSNIYDFKLHEVAKNMSFMISGSADQVWSMNLDTWKSLPADIQKVMEDLRPDVMEYDNNLENTANAAAREKLEAGGVQFAAISSADQNYVLELEKGLLREEWLPAMEKQGLGTLGKQLLDRWFVLAQQ